MKLNRLIEIIIILLNRRAVTAAELAHRFGVSTRTIYRDVDALSSAGIPVTSAQGAGGGISIMEHYALSRASLTDAEKSNILFALKAMGPTGHPEVGAVLEKLSGLFQTPDCDWIEVDLSPWGADPGGRDRLSDLRDAILSAQAIRIGYVDMQGRLTTREVEPLSIAFKSSAWYLIAFCRLRSAERMFRLSRIRSVERAGRRFDRAEALSRARAARPAADAPPPMVDLALRFTDAALPRLCDEYGPERIRPSGDGDYALAVTLPHNEWLYGYLLSFGDGLTVVSPPSVRRELVARGRAILAKYAAEYDTQLSD
ncbi:MAG: YafY family transcriptional regulator [Clostridiales bacterium]|nr:YafY family transcriptional regulator [Clostridiales bacterium]